ncbi:phage Gp37/Gp68 family protein [Nitrobacter sp. TKz-YC01]
MSDLFHESVPDEWIDKVFAVMALTPQHTYQCLTKRSARMRRYIDDALGRVIAGTNGDWPGWPLPNVWLGVSTERQKEADERIPDLLATPAAVRFISAEPLLGPIDLERVGTLDGIRAAMPEVIEREERGKAKTGAGSICGAQIDAVGSSGSSITFFQTPDHMGGFTAASPRQWPRLDWVIVGGESGPGARPMHPDWARSLRDQCAAAGVPFFFKQWGEWEPATEDRGHADGSMDRSGARWVHLDGLMNGPSWHRADHRSDTSPFAMMRVGKKAAGRLLDGVEHNAMPEAVR